MTVKGEDAPVAVYPPGEEVAVYDVAAAPEAFGVNATVAAPLLYARPVPTFVAVPIVGALGCKKSFADSENLPACFDIFIPLYFF